MKKINILNQKTYIAIVLVAIFFSGATLYLSQTEANSQTSSETAQCLRREVSLLPPHEGAQAQPVKIKTELALTDDQRRQGLMHRKYLAADAGMMFFWDAPQKVFMWMKNTLIPLDMIFIKNNKIVGIVEAKKTEDTTSLTVPSLADAVLEVNYGLTKQHGITKGWQVNVGKCLD